MAKTWEFTAVFIDAEVLKQPGEQIGIEQLASRFSNAILDVVDAKKADQWQLVKMDFASGKVTIQFKRLIPPQY
jgi:hypothetical protein